MDPDRPDPEHPPVVGELEPEARPPARREPGYYQFKANAQNTWRAYQADLRHFTAWGGQLPAHPDLVARYLSEHAESLAPTTLEHRLAAVSIWHKHHGHPNPTEDGRVRRVMQGIRRSAVEQGWQPREAPAMTAEDLVAIVDAMGDSLRDARDRALILTGLLAAFRENELSKLHRSQLHFQDEGVVLRRRHSKTNQKGNLELKAIPRGQGPYCAVAALETWLRRAGIDDGPVFRRIRKNDRIGDRPLSHTAVNQLLKRRGLAAGLPHASRLSGHSLRAGFSTLAARGGDPGWKIRLQTGHRDDRMLQRYIRVATLFEDNPAATVLATLNR